MDCLPQIHVAAIHAEAGYRSDIPGLGVFCRIKEDGFVAAGRYSNSVGRISNYAVTGYQPWQVGPARVGAFVGVIDGYPYKNGRAFLAAGAAVSAPMPWGGEAHVVVTPPTAYSPLAVALSFTIALGALQ